MVLRFFEALIFSQNYHIHLPLIPLMSLMRDDAHAQQW